MCYCSLSLSIVTSCMFFAKLRHPSGKRKLESAVVFARAKDLARMHILFGLDKGIVFRLCSGGRQCVYSTCGKFALCSGVRTNDRLKSLCLTNLICSEGSYCVCTASPPKSESNSAKSLGSQCEMFGDWCHQHACRVQVMLISLYILEVETLPQIPADSSVLVPGARDLRLPDPWVHHAPYACIEWLPHVSVCPRLRDVSWKRSGVHLAFQLSSEQPNAVRW